MSSWKARKGNPFERLIAYNLKLLGFKVDRIDDNTKGIDLIVEMDALDTFIIECKFHKRFSWNEIEKVFNKTKKETELKFPDTEKCSYIPLFIFKGNQQPVLIASKDKYGLKVCSFKDFFYLADNWTMKKIPKGYKVWRENG